VSTGCQIPVGEPRAAVKTAERLGSKLDKQVIIASDQCDLESFERPYAQ
jgi:hypothetical protein